jgi:uncharacterized protein YjdB
VNYTVSPDNATDKTVSVSSNNPNIAEAVLEGTQVKITAKTTNGTAKITITTTDGAKTAELNVTVSAAKPLQGITLNSAILTLNKDATGTLTASLNPTDTTTDPGLTWTSSDTSVADIEGSGKAVTIRAKGKGSATITVKSTADPTKTASCNVTVSVPLTGLTLSEDSLTLNPSGAATLTVSPVPTDADLPASLSWSSSDTSAATVSPASGSTVTVTAGSIGNAGITVSGGGKSASCTVNVTNEVILITSISLGQDSLSLVKGESQDLTLTISPPNATNKNLSWYYEHSIVSVELIGSTVRVTGIGGGEAWISAGSTDGSNIGASCQVTVSVPVSGVSLNHNSLTMQAGEPAQQLIAAIQPGDADNQAVSWSSNNSPVASVDSSGRVSALSAGTATITATSTADSTKTAACTVTVLGQGGSGGLSVVFEGFGDEHIDLTVNGPALSLTANNAITVIPPAGYDSYIWHQVGHDPRTSSDPEPYGLSAVNLGIGTHEITLVCVKNSRSYSKTLRVSVGY